MNRECEAVTAAMAAGEPVDAEHLAGCAACRARSHLATALGQVGRAPVIGGPPRVDPVALGAAVRRRRAARVGSVLALVAAVVLAVAAPIIGDPAADSAPAAAARFGGASAPLVHAPAREDAMSDLDLFAVLDDADRAIDAPILLDEDLLALLDPADPLTTADTLEAAFVGDWSP